MESISKVKPIIKNPSKSILQGVAEIAAGKASEENYPTDSEEKVKDVAVFLTTDDGKEALCIAKKYNAKYVYLTGSEINKYYWISYAAYKEHIFLEGSSIDKVVVINVSIPTKEIQSMLVNERAINSTFVKLYLTGEYDSKSFNLVYHKDWIKIFSINYQNVVC